MDVALAQHLFELGTQLLATVLVDVEMLHRDAEHLVLEFVDREARVDEEDGVLLRVGVTADHERGESALHGADGGHAVGRVDVEVKEVLDEARGLFF